MNVSHMIKRLAEEPKPIRFLVSRLLAKTGLSELFGLTIRRDTHSLYFFNTALSMTLWLDPSKRMDDLQIIRALTPRGGTYVDIGANIGDLALAGANQVGPSGRVYAFEAHPRTYRLLLANIRLNRVDHVFPVNVACGDSLTWATFSDKSSDDMNVIGDGEIMVPVVPAESFLGDQQIDLIKIDVEGYELPVIRGLTKALSRTTHLMLEVGDDHFAKFGYRFADIYDLLIKSGFSVWAQESGDTKTRWIPIQSRDQPFSDVQNLVASRSPDICDLLNHANH